MSEGAGRERLGIQITEDGLSVRKTKGTAREAFPIG